MSRVLTLVAVVVLLGACKSSEEKFCGRSMALYSNQAACLKEYRAMTEPQRTCSNSCLSDEKQQASFEGCAAGCMGRARGESCGGISPKPSSSTSASP